MTTIRFVNHVGWRVYAVGVMMLAIPCLAWGVFDPGQPVPADIPGYTLLAHAAATLMLVAAAATAWRRTAAWGAAVLAGYYVLIVVILMNGPILVARFSEYGPYEAIAVQLAIAAGALLVFAANAGIDANRAARLTRLGQILFGVCAMVFGGRTSRTWTLPPRWSRSGCRHHPGSGRTQPESATSRRASRS